MATAAGKGGEASAQTEALWRALQVEDEAGTLKALADGGDVQAQDLIGSTALHMVVVFWGDVPMTQRILDAGADLEARNGDGQTPLAAALRHAHYGSPEPAQPGAAMLRAVVALLLKRGASARVQDDRGRSLLAPAIELHDVALFDHLLAAGAPLPDDALMLVLAAGASIADPDMLRRVLELAGPAQIEARTHSGLTLAHRLAGSARTLAALQLVGRREPAMLTRTADDGRTPMHEAALYGNVEGLRWLAGNGGDVNAVTEDGLSVLHMAAIGGNTATLAWMIEQKPDLALRDRSGMRAVDLYIESPGFAYTEDAYKLGRVRALGGGEAEVARGRTAHSPLHAAISARDLKAVERLLEQGADPDVIDGNGYSALSAALSLSIRSLNVPADHRFGEKLLRLLMEHGADPGRRVPAHSRTLIEDADALGRREEIEKLRERYLRRHAG